MLEILRDPIWQFTGAFLALVAILISVIQTRIPQQRKKMSHKTISVTPVLSIAEDVKGKLAIWFDKKSVQDLHRIVIKIFNSGDLPTRSADYDSPVRCSFGAKAQVLAVEVTETTPTSLQASVKATINKTMVVLTPILLNPEDSVTLDLLVNQYESLEVEGRIVGVGDIREAIEGRIDFSVNEWIAILGTLAVFAVVATVFLSIAGNLILAVFSYGLGATGRQVYGPIIKPLLNDPSYRAGFLWGLITAFMIGWISNQILFLRATRLRFRPKGTSTAGRELMPRDSHDS